MLWGLNELMDAKCLEHCFWTHRKHSIYATYFGNDNDDNHIPVPLTFWKKNELMAFYWVTLFLCEKHFIIENFKHT